MTEETWNLESLAPTFSEKDHQCYVQALETALTNENIKNIALSGSYGSGKSSILQKIKETKKRKTIELSLSTLDAENYTKSDDEESAIPAQAMTLTNRIQQEIVKQLLYRERPNKTPESRFQRIEKTKILTRMLIASLFSFILTSLSVVYDLGHTFEKNLPLPNKFIPYIYIAICFFTIIIIYSILHKTANKLRIKQLSAGTASVTLDEKSVSYFDQYLDEIVYFFEVTKYDLVIFEDIDRFNDQHIFDTLRSLNTLLNNSSQIRNTIRFIYAVKDSIFIESSSKKEDIPELTYDSINYNRTKFFDIIIPIVPFITHQTARSLFIEILNKKGKHKISSRLINIALSYIPDMRLLKNILNEFIVFKSLIIPEGRENIDISEDEIFSMVLYKNTKLNDFEKIRFGESKLDQLYSISRELIEYNIKNLNNKCASIRNNMDDTDIISDKSNFWGHKLIHCIKKYEEASNFSLENQPIEFQEKRYDFNILTTEKFWHAFASLDNKEIAVLCHGKKHYISNGYQQIPSYTEEIRLTKETIINDIGNNIDIKYWKDSYNKQLEKELLHEKNKINSLIKSDFSNLINSREFYISDEENKTFSEKAKEILGESLAYKLIEHGYINRNFTLCAAQFHDTHTSINAMNFILHHINTGSMDVSFYLDRNDVINVLQEYNEYYLDASPLYNKSIVEYVIDNDKDFFKIILESLTVYGEKQEYFLKYFLTSSKKNMHFISHFTPSSSNTISILITKIEIDNNQRNNLINKALEHLSPNKKQEIDEKECDYIKENYSKFSIFFSNKITDTQASNISLFFQENKITFYSLEKISSKFLSYAAEFNIYEITYSNLKILLDNEIDPSLNNIKMKNNTIYEYVISNFTLYISAIKGNCNSLEKTENTLEIINDIIDINQDWIYPLLETANKNCIISDISNIPKKIWSAFAENLLLKVTLSNISKYIEYSEEIDSSLAKILTEKQFIETDTSEIDEEKENLAYLILSSHENIPSPNIRVNLVKSLDISEPLNCNRIEIEKNSLFIDLVKANIINDNEETYRHLQNADWETRKKFIITSYNFPNYMNPELIQNDIENIFNNDMKNIQNIIIDNIDEYIAYSNNNTLKCLAIYAYENKYNVPLHFIERIIINEILLDKNIIVELLNSHWNEMTNDQLIRILLSLKEPYASLAKYGTDVPSIPVNTSTEKLLNKLKDLNIVSSVKEKENGVFKVWKRHSEK